MGQEWKYTDLEKLTNIYPYPAVVLGNEIWWTIKYDGSCVCVWNNEELDEVMVSSRNLPRAGLDIQRAFLRTPQAIHLVALITENPDYYCFGELLIKGKSPTKIEHHKTDRFIGFNIRAPKSKLAKEPRFYLPIDETYEIYKAYSIPTSKPWAISCHNSLESLYEMEHEMIRLAKKRRREGVVGKTVDGLYMWKSKYERVIPKKVRKSQKEGPQLPPLPESEAYGAVDKVFVDLGWEAFQDKRIAMPKVAEYIQHEMRKHGCRPPMRNFYIYYTSYLEDKREAMT